MSDSAAGRDALGEHLRAARRAGRTALIPYVTAGFPDLRTTADLLRQLGEAGADAIELGVPFSDPLADGPTIQRSSQHALKQSTSVADVLELVRGNDGSSSVPIVLFSYLNPLLAYGIDSFLREAAEGGARGLLVTDLPFGGDLDLEGAIERSPLSLVRLVAPTTPPERARVIARRSRGFLYYVARTGVTGTRSTVREALAGEIAELRSHTDLPIAAGFGISTPEQAAEVGRIADGVVVGSALVEALGSGGIAMTVDLLGRMRHALDHATAGAG